jgi:nucleoside-diphosphate-sugar epimerase
MRVAVVGADGFVGTALCAELERRADVQLVRVRRADYDAVRTSHTFDIVVNAAMPSRRFAARKNPAHDFEQTVATTSRILYDFSSAKIVQISSVSARSQLDTVYGRHKRAAEVLADNGRNLVVRLGPLYDPALSKGVIIDLLRGQPVYCSAQSRYAFTPLGWAARRIADSFDKLRILEIGARSSVRLGDLAAHLNSLSTFSGAVDDQIFADAPNDAPAAEAVKGFIAKWRETVESTA